MLPYLIIQFNKNNEDEMRVKSSVDLLTRGGVSHWQFESVCHLSAQAQAQGEE